MAREPSYPEDAPVGGPKHAGEPKEAGETSKKGGSDRTRNIVTGAAIGIGSAALVAALLYANRSRRNDKNDRADEKS